MYYTTDDGGEFTKLMKYNIAGKTSETIMTRSWDIVGSYFTESGKYQVTYINEDAKNTIEVMDVASSIT